LISLLSLSILNSRFYNNNNNIIIIIIIIIIINRINTSKNKGYYIDLFLLTKHTYTHKARRHRLKIKKKKKGGDRRIDILSFVV